MKLIIVEKPDVARHVAAALQLEKKEDYYSNQNYLLTNMRGHLFTTVNHSHYTGSEGWIIEKLPILPEKLAIEITNDSYAKKQINLISRLLKQATLVINGMDSDREGELIFRTLKEHFNIKLPMKRLWLQDLDDSTIRNAVENLYDYNDLKIEAINTNLARLSQASELRSYLDWIIGINATQFTTLKYGQGKQISLGRVQTAVLKILGDRQFQNENHQKTFSYKIIASHFSNGTNFKTTSVIFETKNEAEQVLTILKDKYSVVSFDTKDIKKNPPLLFDLNALIIEANSYFKYTAAQILETAQSLYEKKLLSYPRTDCQYIKVERFSKFKDLVLELANYLNIEGYDPNDNPISVNDQKVDSSHDAIICINSIKNEKLSDIEKNIYDIVAARMLQSFSNSAIYTNKKIVLKNEIEFIGTSSEPKFLGHENIKIHFLKWKFNKGIDYSNNNDNNEQNFSLPKIEPGTNIEGTASLKEIESKPKPIFTVATLTNALMKIVSYLNEEGENVEEFKKYINFNDIGLGTENTRVHIIERLIKINYVHIKNNQYYLTDFGRNIYTMVKDTKIAKVSNTARMEMQLKMLENKDFSFPELKGNFKNFTHQILEDLSIITPIENLNVKESIGKCPKCKVGEINENVKSFSCSEYKKGCDFTIWKTIAGKNLSLKVAQDLLSKKETNLIKGFTGKKGKFDARLKLSNDLKVEFKF